MADTALLFTASATEPYFMRVLKVSKNYRLRTPLNFAPGQNGLTELSARLSTLATLALSCWAFCFFVCAALRAVGRPTQHYRFRFASALVSISARGAASPRTAAGELHRQCFASVGQFAGAQLGYRLACASCWDGRCMRRGLAPGTGGRSTDAGSNKFNTRLLQANQIYIGRI